MLDVELNLHRADVYAHTQCGQAGAPTAHACAVRWKEIL
jgi:hypothetical protein